MPLPLPMPRRNWSAYALPEHWTSSICPPRRISSPSLRVGNITPTTLRKAENKSTRQVSKAEPVEPAVAEKLIDEARAVKAADDAKAVSAGNAVDTEPEQRDDADTDADDEAANAAQRAAFHESEERADVEAPAATTDSLGAGLDSFLPAAATERCDSTIFSHSVSTRVGRVLIIALRCVLAQRDNASDRQPLEAFWRGIIELQVDTR